ncbi:enoyl-CoA hydratase/isomerase family protein [Anaerobacillus sp. CMMVII]|uniref:enoyl-CoA hydratase/isomerase family protein n=1 Tax=Anaerobacillus sp. CMMVII TaxID=2755588 RepID=UPI0021B72669|nr:enoyl-CoA hydratase-related protein [Anaerobacillus sp. CMMVII]MCT8140049.1 enoyl-CoA hydratase/isomerase family protein [Anaerobacillus sp. CMMVII]
MKNGTVLLEAHNGIATITLNRPEVKNAINLEMHEDLQQAFTEADNDPTVKVIILQGKEGAFSSGADLKSIPVHDFASFDHGDYLAKTYNKLIEIIEAIDKPIIAYLNGTAVGAGLSIALACDFRYAEPSAILGVSFLKIALVPDAGASYYLPRIVGLQKAVELCLGEPITAEEALSCGLINQIGNPSEFATKLTQVPSTTFGLMKKNMRNSFDKSLTEVLEMEVQTQRQAGKTPEHMRAIQSFVMKGK